MSTALFMGSALVASRVAYDTAAAHAKLALLCVGVAIGLALVALARRSIRTAFTLGALACSVAVLAVSAAALVMREANAASAAGALVVLIPLAGCASGWRPRRGIDAWTAGAALSLVVGCLTLAATREWSAIVAFAGATAFLAWAWWRVAHVAHRRGVAPVDVLVVAVLGAGAMLYLGLLFSRDLTDRLTLLLGPGLVARPELWHDVRAMVGDYRFTGCGLAGSAMVMSSYLFLLHVPYHPHAHNLFLQVALEQGIPGLVGLLGMFVAAGWSVTSAMRSEDTGPRRAAASIGVALAGLGLYGLVESDLHDSGLVSFALLPFGFAWALGLRRSSGSLAHRSRTLSGPLSLLIGLVPLGMVGAMLLWPGARAGLRANLGAVSQSRAELSVYEWPRWSIQDRLRREHVVDLGPAVGRYRSALALDRSNVTALRRLGQIELSLGHYPEALRLLQRALVAGSNQRVTQRLVAEAYAVTGNATAAATLWRSARTSTEELEPRLWWYRHVGEEAELRHLQEAVSLLERPDADAGLRP